MQDHKSREPLLPRERAHQLHHLILAARIEAARRLVEKEHARLLHQGAGQHGLLRLAAGKLVEETQLQLFQPDAADHGFAQGQIVLPDRPAEVGLPSEQDAVKNRRAAQLVFLRHIGDAPGQLAAAQRRDRHAVEKNFSLRRRADAVDACDKRALADAVVSQDGNALAVRGGQVHAGENLRFAVGIGQIPHLNHENALRFISR